GSCFRQNESVIRLRLALSPPRPFGGKRKRPHTRRAQAMLSRRKKGCDQDRIAPLEYAPAPLSRNPSAIPYTRLQATDFLLRPWPVRAPCPGIDPQAEG